MNKICTSLEQSQKLIELGIDVNTADMYWWTTSTRYYIDAMDDGDFSEAEGHIRAWSLSALLSMLPKSLMYTPSPFLKGYCCKNIENDVETYGDDAVDAAFEMIIWLKKNNKL